MLLDYNSLLIALGFSGGCMFLMLLANWLAARAEQTMLGWAISVALIVCNVLFYSRYADGPGPMLGIAVFVTLLAGLAMLLAMGRQFRTHRPQWWFALGASLVSAAPAVVAMLYGSAGLAFVFYNIAAAGLLLATAWEYWRAREEAPLSIGCLCVLYSAIGISFALCVIPLVANGLNALDGAPRDWAETVNIVVSIAGMSGIGALSLTLNLSKLAKSHRDASLTDGLTGLPNRRALFDRFGGGVRPFTTLLLFDLDRFKGINDEFGHAVGDEVLRAFAEILAEGLRPADFPARLGGEEFLVVLPRSTQERGMVVAENIRRRFAAEIIPTERGDLRCTVSAGIAFAGPGEGQTLDALLHAADQELYGAKHAGRNRVGSSHLRLAG
jgi:diguanylate cyclase (GGDEF)-like protein